MAFKSYAQGGNYSSYAINLPIDKKINEDLRVAGGKVRDIQLIAQHKQSQSSQYVNALNDKFKVEQENRETNARFMMENYKAIYEGEQRQFEGELSELKREYAESQQRGSEPSTLQKVLPQILSLVKVGAGLLAADAAARTKAGVQAVDNVNDVARGQGVNLPNFLQNLGKTKESGYITPETFETIKGGLAEFLSQGGTPDVQKSSINAVNSFYGGNGKIQQAWQTNAALTALRTAQHQAAVTIDPTTYGDDFLGYQRDVAALTNKLVKENLPKDYPLTLESQALISDSNRKFNNKMAAQALPIHKQAAQRKINEVGLHELSKVSMGTVEYHGKTKGQGLALLTKNWADGYWNGDIVKATQHLTELMENYQGISSNDLIEWRSIMPQINPGSAGADPTKTTSVLQIIDEATHKKVKQEQNAINTHNRGVAQQEQQHIREIGNMEREQAQQALTAAQESGGNLSPNVEKALKARAAGQSSKAAEQAKRIDTQLPMKVQESIVERAVEAAMVEKYGDKYKNYTISPEIIEEVRRDTISELAVFAREKSDFNDNFTDYYKKAADIATDKQKWGVEGSGLTGTLSRESLKYREQDLSAFNKSFRDTVDTTAFLAGSKSGFEEMLEKNQKFNTALIDIGQKLSNYQKQTDRPLMNSDVDVYTNHPKIVAITNELKKHDRHVSRGMVLEAALKAATGKDPGITSGITTRQEMVDAWKRGVTYNDTSYTGRDLIQGKVQPTVNPTVQSALGLTNMSATAASTDATGFRDYDTSKYSPEELAMQDTIRYAEGTFSEDGYNTWAGFQKPAGYPTDFGMRDISTMHHWQTKFDREGYTKKTGSAVYGGYQFLDGPAYARQAGLDPDKAYLNAENQDAMAQAALNNKGITTETLRANGLTDEYIDKLAPTWASFPNLIGPDNQGRVGTRSSFYGQGGKTAEALKEFYQQRLGVYNKRGWPTMQSNPPGMDYGKSKQWWRWQ